MLKAWILILLVGAAVMALPAVALAQSAGDDQYQDPLSGGGGGSSNSGGGSSNSGGGGSASGAGNSGTAGASASSASSAQPGATTSSQANQLPRTGLPAGVLALTGAALLGSGVALRRRVTPRTDQ